VKPALIPRDETPPIIAHGASEAIVNTTRNERISAHLSVHRECIVKMSGHSQCKTYECELSPGRLATCPLWFATRPSDHLAELSEE
jgi:hypothetical protein